nr:unnamed protein product [Callosobruchus chinensis]
MQEWLKLSLLLSIFGFLKEIRPSEPFIYEFLISNRWRNVTDDEVTQIAYPVGTYSYLVQLVVVFLITDLCRYKPLIVILGISGCIVWSLLLWTKSLAGLIIVEIFYGTFCASEVAYYTYIYAKVDTEYFQLVTSHTRAAILAGSTISGILAQLLVSLEWMDYRQLNYITFAAMIAATLWTFLLPPVNTSIYFHQEGSEKQPLIDKFQNAFALMGAHFCNSFRNTYVLKWSLWYALSTCSFIQVQTYMQPLWSVIVEDPEHKSVLYNGAVQAILTVLGFLGALLAGILKADWQVKGDLTLTLCSLSQGFLILYTSRTHFIFASYACYVVYGSLYYFMITVTSSEVAKQIKDESYGLVFGVNTFTALTVQTILTAVVVMKGVGLALAPRDQYFVYGCVHICTAVIFIVIGFVSWLAKSKDYRRMSVSVQVI